MQKNIFAYTAPGADYPEFVSINEQDDGRITVCVRGPKKMHAGAAAEYEGPGETVDMTLPRDRVAELIQSLLTLPPVDDVKEAKPIVLYFATDADRRSICTAAVHIDRTCTRWAEIGAYDRSEKMGELYHYQKGTRVRPSDDYLAQFPRSRAKTMEGEIIGRVDAPQGTLYRVRWDGLKTPERLGACFIVRAKRDAN